MQRDRQPTEWVMFVDDVWKEVEVDGGNILETEGRRGVQGQVSVVSAENEHYLSTKETTDKGDLDVYGILNEGMGLKEYLHSWMQLKVEFRTGDIGLRESRRRFGKVDDEDDKFKCDCGSECKDRVHVVADCPLYKLNNLLTLVALRDSRLTGSAQDKNMPSDLTRAFLEKVVRGSGWSLAEVESLSLEGEGIRSLRGSLGGLRRLVYLNLARNILSSLLGIEHLVSLGTLVLRENRVESIDEVGRLSCLGDLRNLDLRRNPVMETASRRHGGGRSGDRGSGSPRADVVAVLPQLVTLDGRGVREDERLPHRPRRGQQCQHQHNHQHQHWQQQQQQQQQRQQQQQQRQQRGSARFPARPATSARSPRSKTGEPEGLASAERREEGDGLRTTTTTTMSARRSGNSNNNQSFSPEAGVARLSRRNRKDDVAEAGSGGLCLPAPATAAQFSSAGLRPEGRVAVPVVGRPNISSQTPSCDDDSSKRGDNGWGRSVGGSSGAAEPRESGCGAPGRGRRWGDSRELHVVEIAAGGGGRADCRREKGRSLSEHPAGIVVDWARRKRDLSGAQGAGKGRSSSRSSNSSLAGGDLVSLHLEDGVDLVETVCGGGDAGEEAVVVEDLGGKTRMPHAGGGRLGGRACADDDGHRHPRRQEPPHVAGVAAPWTPAAATAVEQPSSGSGGGGGGGDGDDDLAALWRELGTTRESLTRVGTPLAPPPPPRPTSPSSSSARDSKATATTTTTSSKKYATAASGSAAARAVEAFRRSSQRLGLLYAGAGPAPAAADGVAVDGGRRSLAISVGDGDGAVEDAAPRSPLTPTTTTTPARTARDLPCCPGSKGRTAGCGHGDCAGSADESRGGGGSGCGGPKGPTDTKCGDDVTPAARSASPVAAVLVAPSTGRPAFARVRRGEEESAITAAGGRALAEGEVAAAAAADAGGMWFPAHGDMAEWWWAREREFEAKWCARERDFDARWAAREREFDQRLHEGSKEFAAEMRSMLLSAHEALISSNARLVERLKAAEAAAAAAAKLASTGSPTSAPGGGATARRMWSSSGSSNAQARPATSAAGSSTADLRSANTALLLRRWRPSRSGVNGGAVSEYSDHVAAPSAGVGGAGDPGGDTRPCAFGGARVCRAASVPVPPPPADDNGGGRSRSGGAMGVIAPTVAFADSQSRSFTADVPAASGYKSVAASAGDMDPVQPPQGDGVVESTGKVAPGTEGGKETGRGSKAIVSADSLGRVDSWPPSCLVGQGVDDGGGVEVSSLSCSDEGRERRIAGDGSASPLPIDAVSTAERSQEGQGDLKGRARCMVPPVWEATPMSNFDESSKLDGVVAVDAASAPLAVACDGGEVFGREPEVTFSVS
ncbi:unnamed protein product [Ectocarpus sp. CCAP 1310/34]|nr:unnamed protein product [Ectocarpus sp. CCAP 1310/34]